MSGQHTAFVGTIALSLLYWQAMLQNCCNSISTGAFDHPKEQYEDDEAAVRHGQKPKVPRVRKENPDHPRPRMLTISCT